MGNKSVPGWVVAVIVVVVLVLVGFFGYNKVKAPPALDNQTPPPWIDPVTKRPKGNGPGSGAQGGAPGAPAGTPGAAAGAPSGNGG